MRNAMMVMVGVSLALYAGCAGSPAAEESDEGKESTEAADQPAPIVQLDLEAGHAVKFYEPSPGALFIVEEAASGQPLILSEQRRVDALALFAKLRPGQSVPAALDGAHARALAASHAPHGDLHAAAGGGSPAPALTAAARAGMATAQQALSSSADPDHFVNTDHGCDWDNAFSFCRIRWSNGLFIEGGITDSGVCIVDHYAGNGIGVKLTAGVGVLSQLQPVGTEVAYAWGIINGDVFRRMDIFNASGDHFHAGCRFAK